MATLESDSPEDLGTMLAVALVVYALLLLALGVKELHQLNQTVAEQREAARDAVITVPSNQTDESK